MSAANSLPWNDQGIRFTVDIKTISENNAREKCRDQVAKELGINDGDEAHEWLYEQRKPRPREVGLQVGGYGV